MLCRITCIKLLTYDMVSVIWMSLKKFWDIIKCRIVCGTCSTMSSNHKSCPTLRVIRLMSRTLLYGHPPSTIPVCSCFCFFYVSLPLPVYHVASIMSVSRTHVLD